MHVRVYIHITSPWSSPILLLSSHSFRVNHGEDSQRVRQTKAPLKISVTVRLTKVLFRDQQQKSAWQPPKMETCLISLELPFTTSIMASQNRLKYTAVTICWHCKSLKSLFCCVTTLKFFCNFPNVFHWTV